MQHFAPVCARVCVRARACVGVRVTPPPPEPVGFARETHFHSPRVIYREERGGGGAAIAETGGSERGRPRHPGPHHQAERDTGRRHHHRAPPAVPHPEQQGLSHTHTHTYTDTHTQTHTHTHTRSHAHTHTHMQQTLAHTHTHIHTYMQQTLAHTHTHPCNTHLHTRTQHTHTHTNTHATNTCTYTHTHPCNIHLHTHIHVQHTHTHTHAHTLVILHSKQEGPFCASRCGVVAGLSPQSSSFTWGFACAQVLTHAHIHGHVRTHTHVWKQTHTHTRQHAGWTLTFFVNFSGRSHDPEEHQGGGSQLGVPHRHRHRQLLHARRHHQRPVPAGQPRVAGARHQLVQVHR